MKKAPTNISALELHHRNIIKANPSESLLCKNYNLQLFSAIIPCTIIKFCMKFQLLVHLLPLIFVNKLEVRNYNPS